MSDFAVVKRCGSAQTHRKSVFRCWAEVGQNGHGQPSYGCEIEKGLLAKTGIEPKRANAIIEALGRLAAIA